MKRIGSTAWRIDVSGDGKLFSLSVRTETGREYEVLLGTVDSSPILSDLLAEMARVHRAMPPQEFAQDAGPNHPKSRPVEPLSTRVVEDEAGPILVHDFGGTVLKVRVARNEIPSGIGLHGKGAEVP